MPVERLVPGEWPFVIKAFLMDVSVHPANPPSIRGRKLTNSLLPSRQTFLSFVLASEHSVLIINAKHRCNSVEIVA
jgi:hypothetical protein